jgi:hypothetical protein
LWTLIHNRRRQGLKKNRISDKRDNIEYMITLDWIVKFSLINSSKIWAPETPTLTTDIQFKS